MGRHTLPIFFYTGETMLDHILQTVFENGVARYSEELDSIVILEDDKTRGLSNVLVVDLGVLDRDFENFVRSLSGTKTVAVQALFATQVNLQNNSYQKRSGKWETLSSSVMGFGADQCQKIAKLLRQQTSPIRDQALGVDLLSDSFPIYKKGEINRKVEKKNGTMPTAHVVHIPYENSIGGVGYRVSTPIGVLVKAAIELNGRLHTNQNGTYLYSDGFVWIAGHHQMIMWRGKEVEDCLTVPFDSGTDKTKRDPRQTSWQTEEEAIKKIVTAKAVYNPAKQPPVGASLAQMCNYWAGNAAEEGVEALKWAGYTDQQVIDVIERNRHQAERAFLEKFVYEAFNKLGQSVHSKNRSYYSDSRNKLDEIMLYIDAFHERGISFDPTFIESIKELNDYIDNTNKRGNLHGFYQNT